MKTNPLYLSDPYLKTTDAEIIDIIEYDNFLGIILDKTVFYPIGGGQPCDIGEIKLGDQQIKVVDVIIKDSEINHFVSKNSQLQVGDRVTLNIDWNRRSKNMQIHSAGHVIDFALTRLGISPNILFPFKGNHGSKSSIVYKGKTDKNFKEELQQEVNSILKQNLEFSWEFLTYEELTQKAGYLQEGLPKNKPLRALTLQNYGTVADGGTIVKNTSELLPIIIGDIQVDDEFTTVNYSVDFNSNLKSDVKIKDNDQPLSAEFEKIYSDVANEVSLAKGNDELTNLWRKYLGKEGTITGLMKQIVSVPQDQKKSFGANVNNLRDKVDKLINSTKDLNNQKMLASFETEKLVDLDYSMPKIGHLHPLTETINELNNIFRSLGYSIMDGPEIETDEYCFQRLNLPIDHPARDLQDSIFIEEPNILMRTQTSSIESRTLEMYEPPFKVVMPGRVYRNEKVNRSNHFTFHQYQLTVVQEKVSMAELLSTIDYLFKSFLGDDVVTRYRNKYYPEVEPGVGPDMQCFECHGVGCQLCKGRGWLEMGGAGIIHPNVLKMAGLDPKKWQGYAFGLGLDRWAMAKHKITDIRTLLGGNLAYKPNLK